MTDQSENIFGNLEELEVKLSRTKSWGGIETENSYGPADTSDNDYAEKLAGFMDQTRAYTENRAIPGEVPIELIAEAVAFFASDKSSRCTGVDLPVDGGAHAGRFIPGFNTL